MLATSPPRRFRQETRVARRDSCGGSGVGSLSAPAASARRRVRRVLRWRFGRRREAEHCFFVPSLRITTVRVRDPARCPCRRSLSRIAKAAPRAAYLGLKVAPPAPSRSRRRALSRPVDAVPDQAAAVCIDIARVFSSCRGRVPARRRCRPAVVVGTRSGAPGIEHVIRWDAGGLVT